MLHTLIRLVSAIIIFGALARPSAPAEAHPHVWVTAKAEVVYEGGNVVAIEHHWTFDEFYTATAIEGLDKNGDGVYSRDELADLAKTNMEGLKEFEYFTFAVLGKEKLAFAEPRDAWLEHKDGILTLHYRLPLAKPVPASAKGFAFAVYDPSFFIAFEMAKESPVTLTGAPPGCKIAFGQQQPPDDASQPVGSTFSSPATRAAFVSCVR